MIRNATTLPKVYYGLHFSPGVAEYREAEQEPYRILINEQTIKNMDPTFQGKPVYVDHVEEVDLENIQAEADGYVMESFYNALDGKHWVKFIVVSDRGHEAIRKGWRLSNAYVPTAFVGGGLWHGVEYAKEVTNGEYEHLAIVKHPRYEESIILTPEEFKAYNGEKELALKKLANSKDKKQGEKTMGLKFFKRAKVDNSADLESMSVTLPKSGKEMTITDLVTEMDAIHNMHGYANGDHLVKVGEDEMSVNDLVKKHMDMCNEMAESKKAADEKAENDAEDGDGDESMDNAEDDEKKDDKKENEEDVEAEKAKKNAADAEAAAKKAVAKEKADRLRNAHLREIDEPMGAPVEFSADQVARGKARYGS